MLIPRQSAYAESVCHDGGSIPIRREIPPRPAASIFYSMQADGIIYAIHNEADSNC